MEGLAAPDIVGRTSANRHLETYQWQHDTFVEKLDDNSNVVDVQMGLKLPPVVVEAIRQAKEQGGRNNIFKGIFQIGNAAYIIVNNRVFLWFFEGNQKLIMHDFDHIVTNLCKI